jgi:hypothetical protein
MPSKKAPPSIYQLKITLIGIAVMSKNSCGTGIELEQASESLATLNGVAARFGFIGGIREQQLVAFTLMVAFAVIMRAELGQSPHQGTFAE